MKKLFTLIFIFINISSFSQPSIISSEIPGFGYRFTYKHVSTFTAIDTSLHGANQVWNFSSLTLAAVPDKTFDFLDPAQTPYVASFPGADICVLEQPDPSYNYYNKTATVMERLGDYDSVDGYTTYSDPQVEWVFPMAMGVTNSDPWVSTGSPFPGTYDLNCVGYGTLMVPGHTYLNVIMAHIVVTSGVALEFYFWYDSDNGLPVLEYIVASPFYPAEAFFLDNVSADILENSFASSLQYNNPVSSTLHLKLFNEKTEAISYTLLNSTGQIILSGEMENAIDHELNLDLENVAAGTYFLLLNDVKFLLRNRSIKIVKQ